jgi:hypothetical protein
LRIVLFLACCVAMAYGLFRSEPPPDLFEDADKFFHVAAFAGLALVTRLAFAQASAWLVWGLLYAQGPMLEYLQHFLRSTRIFSYGDILANFCGVTLALLAWTLVSRAWRRLRTA